MTKYGSSNSNKPTNQMQQTSQVYYLMFMYSSTCFMPIIRGSMTAVAASGLPSERGGSSAVGRGRAGLNTTNGTAITTLRR
jgi:hypothetical protein